MESRGIPTPGNVEGVVLRFLHEVLSSDGAAMDELVASEPLRERAAAFRRSFADVRITPQVVVVQGDLGAVHFSARGIHRGTYQGVTATGRAWTATCGAIFRVQDDRIADFWLVWDVASILEQIGALRIVRH